MSTIKVSLYGAARLEMYEKPSGLTVDVSPEHSGAEYGVWLHPPDAASPQGHLAQFDLQASHPVNLRERKRDKDYYASADRGWAHLAPDEAVLLYATDGGGFSLKQLTARGCEAEDWQCRTDAELRKLLPPRGDNDLLEHALVLLEWTAQHCPYALTPSIASRFEAIDLTAAQTYFRYFEHGRGAGFCAETAQFFSRLLVQEGIESFTWAFGLPQTLLTHVTTIVAQSDQFYLLDPTFGGYFAVPESSQPQPVEAILDKGEFSYREFATSERLFIAAESDTPAVAAQLEAGSIECLEADASPGRMLCRIPGCGLDFYLQAFADLLAQAGIPPGPEGFVELMRCATLGIGDGKADTEPMRQFARMLESHGIALVAPPGMSSLQRLLNDTPDSLPASAL